MCLGQPPGSPNTPTRRSVRLIAKQLYQEELAEIATLVKDSEQHLLRTPLHGRHDMELSHATGTSSAKKPRKSEERTAGEIDTESHNEPFVVITPPQISMHHHFLDSRQLSRTDLATDVTDKTPVKQTPLKRSPLHKEMTESVRRSPRLMAKQDNLLLASSDVSVVTRLWHLCVDHIL